MTESDWPKFIAVIVSVGLAAFGGAFAMVKMIAAIMLKLGRTLQRFETIEAEAEERAKRQGEIQEVIDERLERIEQSLQDVGMLKTGYEQIPKLKSQITELQVQTGVYQKRKSMGDFG